ncbi:uncharacterized protein PFL1_06160 [Pseudozyma flocculosa PF-1]|uniref:Related to PYC2 - pyruvate carboxylase 2 n=2 Tax=Pseudozyma flocculosa TaxID=84751 RepID=A0A5C3F9W2_9BASI|nr:uncharacterized protein PFL1_06160 [Pseudozyma flocculosa PF-1]EPQ26225.1 hypothetical protein PFL1_06160 [Pseudozyma flocculosa PF-1]SPO40181.1 related to PYC2 - pyruvate carboxylase 2 [Pseudozyma flocculosa]
MPSADTTAGQPLRILIANRSEIALRLQRTYSLLDAPRIHTVAIHTQQERNALHVANANIAVQLPANGPRAYLDAHAIVDIAKRHNCFAVAPGYGFLSEDPQFARLLEDAGIVFLGPTSDQLRQLGDKVQARALADSLRVPVLEASKGGGSAHGGASSLDEIQHFARSLGAGSKVILKAAAGGGGRGIRIVDVTQDDAGTRADVESNYRACQREAQLSFGDDRIYAERFLASAKHIEVQVVGDGAGGAMHLWERECSLQRRNQKLVEIAPSPSISDALRHDLIRSALDMARAIRYRSLATFEFLVAPDGRFFFMEANPRIQVEHTITEQITGVDLVALQLQVGLGKTVEQLGLPPSPPRPRTTSIQLRINAESLQPDGTAQPEAGQLTAFQVPTGPNVRIDTAAHAPSPQLSTYSVSPLFDSLLAKVIVTAPDYPSALRLAQRALHETDIRGCKTNRNFLRALLEHPAVQTSTATTATVQHEIDALYRATLRFQDHDDQAAARTGSGGDGSADAAASSGSGSAGAAPEEAPEGTEAVTAHITGVVLELKVAAGDAVQAGAELAVVEAMKMEHVIRAPRPGRVHSTLVATGGAVSAGRALIFLEPDSSSHGSSSSSSAEADAAALAAAAAAGTAELTEEQVRELRPELQDLERQRSYNTDAFRAEAVRKRHARGYLTPREVLARLFDAGSLQEYGELVIAAQTRRLPLQQLMERTQGDGIITGWAAYRSHPVALAAADYLVLAGTQGYFHHLKLDRLFQSVLDLPHPLVFFAEGGGGRPGDTDVPVVAGLNTPSFALLGQIRARGIPSIGVANGYVFAGNAALLGVCDIVVATRGGDPEVAAAAAADGDGSSSSKPKTTATTTTAIQLGQTSIGMGGSAMIEGGGLGVYASEEIGPPSMHHSNGGIDILVDTERDAVHVVRQLLGFLVSPTLPRDEWAYTSDVRRLRFAVPPLSQRKRSYDIYPLLDTLLDDGSFIELGSGWGTSLITGLGRLEGRVVGVLASRSNTQLSGAIDDRSALKATRFLGLVSRLALAHVISLVDTPGFMVGPAFERSSTAGGSFRIFGDLFSAFSDFARGGGQVVSVAIRNAYGLGAQALMGGSTLCNMGSVAWPTASFGAMGLEGAVRLGRKKELEAIPDGHERSRREKAWIDQLYQRGRGEGMARAAEIDAVIDPADTRRWIAACLDRAGTRTPTYVSLLDAARGGGGAGAKSRI